MHLSELEAQLYRAQLRKDQAIKENAPLKERLAAREAVLQAERALFLARGEEAILLPKKEGKEIIHTLTQMFPFTRWRRIDWPQVSQYIELDTLSEVFPVLLHNESNTHAAVFIVWDEATTPVMESNPSTVLSHIEEVTIVSFDTWIFCPTEHYVV